MTIASNTVRCVNSRLVFALAFSAVLSFQSAQGAYHYFDPGGPKVNLAPRELSVSVSRGKWKVVFETPGILEVTESLSSDVWQGVTTAGSFVLDFSEPGPDGVRFYRVAAAERPTRLYIPDSYDPARASPLILCLHGYTNTGEWLENLVRLHPFAEEHRILLCYPDGTVDQDGNQFWNASAGCCDFYGAGVDDSTYLRNLIESVQQTYNVDAKRIYVLGFSNGAFMAHRLAREHSDLIAAIIAAAGTMSVADTFAPSEPVSVQQIHGTLDPIDQTNGGTQAGMEPYLGARATIELWADANGCSVQVEDSEPSRDLYVEIQGNDTTVVTYESYAAGGYVELLSSPVGHGMPTHPDGPQRVVDWFLAHPKP